MKEKRRYTILAVILVVVLLLAGIGYRLLSDRYAASQAETAPTEPQVSAQDESQQETPAEPMPAPDFTVTDQAGNDIRFADQVGQPIILNFWASWCPPCRSELPDFDAASQKYGDEITFMMIDLCDGMRETSVSGLAFVQEQGYTFPVYLDTTYEASSLYGVYSIPMTVGINAEGEIVSVYTGAMSGEQIEALVSDLLS